MYLYIYMYVCVFCVLCLETENIELNNANKDPQKSTGKPSPPLVSCFLFQCVSSDGADPKRYVM